MRLGTWAEQPQSLNLSMYRVLSCKVSFPHRKSSHFPVGASKSLRLGGGNAQFMYTHAQEKGELVPLFPYLTPHSQSMG